MRNLHIFCKLLVITGVSIELSTLSYRQGLPDIYISPIYWFLGGFLTVFGAIPLLVFKNESENTENSTITPTSKAINIIGILTLGTMWTATYLKKTFYLHPSNPLESDVIPTIEILVRRVLSGEWVYGPIQFPGWVVNNAYLPMQYLPFIPAEKLGLDYRWMAFAYFALVIFFWTKHLMLRSNVSYEILLKIWFAFYIIYLIHLHDYAVFAFSLELLDVAFYLVLALSFFHKDLRIKALGLLLCMLSRYAFVFWLPFYALSFWIEYGKKDSLKIIGMVILGVVLLYVLPFMTKQPTLFFDGLKYYDKTAIGQWTDIPDWYKSVGKPYHLSRGLSTSIFFYDHWQGDIAAKLGAARLFHIIACLGSVVLVGITYWFARKRENFNYGGFLLLSLKFYLIFFYGFFYVPFSYLYLLPMCMSIPIVFKLKFIEK